MPPYPWPVKPFDRQHPVRGFFNDPRVQDASHAFHFGIDVSAPDRTAVYAVTPGKVFIEDKGHAVAVQAPDGRAFGYWHVKPAVAHHQQVGLHQLIGHIERAGATSTSPRASKAATSIRSARERSTRSSTSAIRRSRRSCSGAARTEPDRVKGRVQICCIAYDTTPIHVPSRGRTCRSRRRGCATASCAPASAFSPCAPASTCACSASPMRSRPSTARRRARTTPTSRGLLLHPRARLEQRGVRERPLPPRGAGRRRARERRVLDAPFKIRN